MSSPYKCPRCGSTEFDTIETEYTQGEVDCYYQCDLCHCQFDLEPLHAEYMESKR